MRDWFQTIAPILVGIISATVAWIISGRSHSPAVRLKHEVDLLKALNDAGLPSAGVERRIREILTRKYPSEPEDIEAYNDRKYLKTQALLITVQWSSAAISFVNSVRFAYEGFRQGDVFKGVAYSCGSLICVALMAFGVRLAWNVWVRDRD